MERANEKGRREGEEVARRGRGARDGFAWHFAKQHEKDLIIGLSRGRGGMNYTEMKRAGRRRRQRKREAAPEKRQRGGRLRDIHLHHSIRAHHHYPFIKHQEVILIQREGCMKNRQGCTGQMHQYGIHSSGSSF